MNKDPKVTVLKGAPNTGKTTAIVATYKELVKKRGYTEVDYIPHVNPPDFQAVVTKDNKCIIIQSYTDMMVIIEDFERYCMHHLPNYSGWDIMIIVPCRDVNNPRLHAATMSVCEKLSGQEELDLIKVLELERQYFTEEDILVHLTTKGF